MSAEYEVPNQNEALIDGIAINPQGALSGQALIFDNFNNQFIPGSAAGNVNGFFTTGQIAYATGTQSLTTASGTGISNFVWDDTDGYLGIGTSLPSYQLDVRGDGYFTKRLIINGDTAAVVSPSGTGAFRFNSGTNHLEFSENGGAWSQIGVGSVTSVSNSDSTLTISPTTGVVVASLNLGHANTWSAKQTFTAHIAVDGYTIDLSGGATNGQVLTYNGTNFVAQNASGGISGTLTNTKVPYATGSSTIADSGMAWDNTNKVLTVTTLAGNDGVQVTDATRTIAMGVSSGGGGQLGTTSNHNLTFFTNNSSAQLTLNTSGFFGIGASPSYALHVVGDGYFTARTVYNASSAAVSPSGTGAIRYNTATSHLEFSENAGAWTQFGTGGGGSMSIGGAITGATNNRVLYADGSGNLGDTILSLTSSELGPVSDNAISLGDSTHRFVDGYFAGKLALDGYTIDLSAGATTNQVIQYNGTKFVAATVSGGGGFGSSGQKLYTSMPAAFNANNGTTTPMTVGAVRFDPTNHVLSGTTQSVVFRAIAANGSASVVGHVKLRDVTNSVDITTFNLTAGTTSDTLFEQTLTVSTAGTNSIANSAVIYEVRIYVDSPVNANDFVQLYSAEIRNIQTIT